MEQSPLPVTLAHWIPKTGTQEVPVRSFAHALELMDELGPKFSKILRIPYSVDLVRSDKRASLSVGMGNGEWMLVYVPDPDNDDEASVTSLGNPNAEGTIAFWFGDHTEMSRKYLIPRDAALQAVKEWVESGRLSSHVQWTSDLH